MLLEVIGGFGRVEHDRGIEEREKHDQRQIEHQKQRATMTELGVDPLKPLRSLAGVEVRNRCRQQQQRRGKDRRNDAGGIQLKRQMGGLTLKHLVADLAFRILNQKPPLRALHEHDEGDHRDRHRDDDQNDAGRQRALTATPRRCRKE